MKLYSGLSVPNTINVNERIFKIVTFDNETILCNTKVAQELLNASEIKALYHLWNFDFKKFGKKDLKEIKI